MYLFRSAPGIKRLISFNRYHRFNQAHRSLFNYCSVGEESLHFLYIKKVYIRAAFLYPIFINEVNNFYLPFPWQVEIKRRKPGMAVDNKMFVRSLYKIFFPNSPDFISKKFLALQAFFPEFTSRFNIINIFFIYCYMFNYRIAENDIKIFVFKWNFSTFVK